MKMKWSQLDSPLVFQNPLFATLEIKTEQKWNSDQQASTLVT